MLKLLSLIPGPWKWAAGGIAALVLFGGLTWLIHDWRASAVQIAALQNQLQEERAAHDALDKQYKAQIEALANERAAAQARATALTQLEREVNNDAKENDRAVGPVLQRYFERLHNAHDGTKAALYGGAAAAGNHVVQTPGDTGAAAGLAGKSGGAASQ
jgi:hypothetical protein